MPFDKDKLKDKDEEILKEMKQQIDEAQAESIEEEVSDGESVQDTEEAPEIDLAAENEALKTKLAEGEERLKRLQADFENFRRRTRQEKEELSAVR